MRTRTVLLALVVLVVAVGSLAACGDDEAADVVVGSTAPTGPSASEPSSSLPTTTLPPTTPGAADDPAAELGAARARWEAQGLDDYVFELGTTCFCPPEYLGPFLVEVVDGSVASVAFADGTDADPPSDGPYRTVDDIFDVIETAIAEEADELRVTYDPETGVPVDLWIDARFDMADEELGITAELVEPAPS